MMRTRLAIVLAAIVLPPLFIEAHHSGVMFEPEKQVSMEGVVKEFQYTNPHSWLIVDVTNKDGTLTSWGFEAEGPSTLMRNGVRLSDFRVGTKLTITGRPMKDGRPAAVWVKAVRADGMEFYPGGRPGGRRGAPTP